MEDYLKKCIKTASKCRACCGGLKVVMGNESGDLDSVVSSLVYAFLLQSITTEDPPVVPVLNFMKEEFPVKTEVTYYLKQNGIPFDPLIFRDSVNLLELHEAKRLELVLTDHHVIPHDIAKLRSSVVEVLDHHPQDPAWIWPAEIITLQTVGSCCTLVAKKVLEKKADLIDSQVASLLYGPIILDTACFNPVVDRTTELDLQIAAELEARGVDRSKREMLFDQLIAARSDISNLTPKQLLMKDLKITAGIPIPGMPILIEEFITYPGVLTSLQEFCAKNGTNMTVLIGLKIDASSVQRDLAVFNSEATESAKKIVQRLQDSTDPALQLEPVESEIPGLQLFRQLNTKASRKQILPVVKQAAETLAH